MEHTAMTNSPNAEQAEFWSDGAGLNWVDLEHQLDALFANVNAALLNAAQVSHGQKILDIGCGTGATTRDFAARIGDQGQASGIDISTSMLARAKELALPNTTFTLADAQIEPLPTTTYDHLVSRFGVMFFADPIAAFKNLRTSLKPNGRLTMACWAPFKQNPWFTIPRFIATDLLGSPPPMNPRDPGPFAFADPDYVLGILTDAGFINASVDTRDINLSLPGDAENAAMLSSYIGPADSVVRAQGGTKDDKAKIVAATHEKLKVFEINGAVTVPARIHIYSATNP
jgi:SAM-dependent methyltransferase